MSDRVDAALEILDRRQVDLIEMTNSFMEKVAGFAKTENHEVTSAAALATAVAIAGLLAQTRASGFPDANILELADQFKNSRFSVKGVVEKAVKN